MERVWWELTCNADEGWYVTRWHRFGICRASVMVEYGPLALPEIADVLECDAFGFLLEQLGMA